MLRQADAEESKIRTVKLARAAYSGSSPPATGLASYRSTSSTFYDVGSPEVWPNEDGLRSGGALTGH
jgi:hypothetical protein